MSSLFRSTLLAFAVLLCGCDRKGGSAQPTPSSSGKTPGAVSAGAKLARRAEGRCPNWVIGAKTQIADIDGGALLTITASHEPAIAQIRERVRYLAAGKSTSGDRTGQCPVIRDARIEFSDVEGGAKVILRPNEKYGVEQLRRDARARLAASVE